MLRAILFFLSIISSSVFLSQKNVDNLWLKWRTSNHPSERIESMMDIIRELYFYSDPDSALFYTEAIHDLSIKHELKKLEADVLNLKGSIYWVIGNYDEAFTYLRRGLDLSKDNQYKKGIGFAYNCIGMVYSEIGENDSTIFYYEKAMELRKQMNDLKSLSSSLMNIGTYYYEIGNLSFALKYFFESLAIDQKMGYKEDIAMVLSNIGLVYFEQKDYDKAINYFYKSMDIDREEGVTIGILSSLYNIAHVYQKQNKLEQALVVHEKALEIALTLNIDMQIAYCYNNIGSYYIKKGENEVAKEYLEKGLEIRKKINDPKGMASSLNNLGDLYFYRGDYKNAKKYNEAALELALQNGNVEKLKTISLSLYKIYKLKGEYALALKMHEDYLILKDSLFNQENLRFSIQQEFAFKASIDSAHNADLLRKKEDQKIIERFKHNEEISKFRFYGLIGAGLSLMMCLIALFLYRQNKIKQKSNQLIQNQKDEVDIKNKEITESIVYAKRIQDAILVSKEYIDQVLPESYILYMPKDLVSGDFYWVYEENEFVYFSVVDCTGHGVPGAFMSMIGHSILNELVVESKIVETDEILTQLNNQIKSSMEQKGNSQKSRDGMDMAFCRWNKNNNELVFTGAKNALHIVRNGELIEYPGDQRPVGYETGRNIPFTKTIIQLNKGDMVYLFTDGYADQFGGPRGKKFKSNNLKNFLIKNSTLPIEDQFENLRANFVNWKGTFEQVDDVCVLGLRIS